MKKLKIKTGIDKMLSKEQMKSIVGGYYCQYGSFSGVCFCDAYHVHVLDNVCKEDLFNYMKPLCAGISETANCEPN